MKDVNKITTSGRACSTAFLNHIILINNSNIGWWQDTLASYRAGCMLGLLGPGGGGGYY